MFIWGSLDMKVKRLEVEREWSLIREGKPNLEGDRFGNEKPKRSLTNDRTKLGVE